MARIATVFSVLISGPSDTAPEREIVERSVHNWNAQHSEAVGVILQPIRWEKNASPALGNSPQEILNRQIVDSSDGVIAVFRDNIGSPTKQYVSGTAEEIIKLHSSGRRVMIYFCEGKVDRSLAGSDGLVELEKFKAQIRDLGIYGKYEDTPDLELILAKDVSDFARDFVSQAENKDEPLEPELKGVLADVLFNLEVIRRIPENRDSDLNREIRSLLESVKGSSRALRSSLGPENVDELITFIVALEHVTDELSSYWSQNMDQWINPENIGELCSTAIQAITQFSEILPDAVRLRLRTEGERYGIV